MATNLLRQEGLPEWVDKPYVEALRAIHEKKRLHRSTHHREACELQQVIEADLHHGNCTDTGHPNVRRAYEIRMSDDPQTRGKLEAYLLAGLPPHKIAKRLGLSVKVVQLYQHLFFRVQGDSSVDAKQQILAAYKNAPDSEKVPAYAYKIVALAGGAKGLDLLLGDTEAKEISSIEDAASLAAAEAKNMLAFKLVEAAAQIDVSRPNAVRQLTNLMQQFEDVQPLDTLHYLVTQIELLFNALPFGKGEPDPDAYPPKLLQYEMSSIELTYEERLQLMLGQRLENEEELLNLKFPDSPADVENMPKPYRARVEEMLEEPADPPEEETPEQHAARPKSEASLKSSHPPQPKLSAAQLEAIRQRAAKRKDES